MLIKAREKAAQLLEKFNNSQTPYNIHEVNYELGIDQAGRGPVFGSMIYSALWWPVELKEELGSIGFADSKAITQEIRQGLLQILDALRGKLIFYETKDLSAEYISNCMNNSKEHVNLNEISLLSALELVKVALKSGFKITHIIADTVGDPGKYTTFLRNNLTEYSNIVQKITVQPKADRDHKVVSASSICAKVTRDRILKSWKFRQNLQFKGQLGSGYPGDPKTKEWLQNNKDAIFGYPNLVRFSWNTSINALQGCLKVEMIDQDSMLLGWGIFKKSEELRVDLFKVVK